MIRFLLIISILLNFYSVNAKEVVDTNITVDCYANKKFILENFISSFVIEIKKIDFNKDSSGPPKWGNMQSIKIKSSGQSNDAALLLSRKTQIAFSYAESNEVQSNNTVLYIFELDIEKLEMKKTSISIFSNQNNRINNSMLYCKKSS